ncbi:Lytic transglycosylase, catalytic [Ketogulonicigenium robustum]|uniref:Lytic transglycosylase, catalytic n=1 Tax=Ketogulonicigenium robustum TaxID=92947 RepID=A0A1W6P2T4_9RHOB|nr:Lytic transglycosylase, catalytic [Ketogulonicigenium robustum]
MLAILVAGCGSREFSAPRNLDDACSIVAQRPQYLRAFTATEHKWGVPVSVQMAIIYQESKFIGNARPPHQYTLGVLPIGRQSSAYGYSQALDGTWDEYVQITGRRSAQRHEIRDATDFMGWYMSGTRNELNIPMNDTRNQYLAYHEGRNGYRRGSHNSKAWLMRIASELEGRAIMYDAQLRACGRI